MPSLPFSGYGSGIVLALAGAEPQRLGQRRSLRLQFGVGVTGPFTRTFRWRERSINMGKSSRAGPNPTILEDRLPVPLRSRTTPLVCQ
jgi:hypothetical protein